MWGRSPKFILLQTGCNVSVGLNWPKKTTISTIQSLLTSGTTHTSKYGIFRFENTAEALGSADGETNLQDSGDDHSDSAYFLQTVKGVAAG